MENKIGENMPIPNHCIDCDKVATVTLNNVPYCTECGLKAQQEEDPDGKSKRNVRGRYDNESRAL